MICAIATPSAQSAYNATKDSDIPVVYTAVTSPKAAGFVDKEGKNVGNITGTSDLVLADKQLKLIRQMMPKAKNVESSTAQTKQTPKQESKLMKK